jgi:TonB family protein
MRIVFTLGLLVAAVAAAAEPPTAADPEDAPVLATPPRLKELVPAELPPGTAFPSPEVVVLLSIDVSADGAVEGVRVDQGAGEPFDSAAVAAARRFAFEPGRLDTGEPVPVTIAFRMRIAAPPPPAAEAAAEPPPRPVRLEGRLLERGTRTPLASVAVAARSGEETLARATTDADGRFSLEVPRPTFRLVAVPPAHDRLDVAVEATPGELREEVYYLEAAATGAETVVRASPIRREVTRQVLPADEIARIPGTQGDTLKAVLNLPGAARDAFGGGALVLRGSSPGDSRVFVEGQEIPILYHFGGLRSTINPRFLEAVEFVPGNFAPDYGRATGGIVEVRLRDPSADLVRGEAGVSFYDAGVSLEGPLGRGWAGGFAFHRSWIDTLLPAVIPDDADLTFDTAPRYYDYQLVASRALGGQRLRLLFYGSLDKVELLFDEPQEDPKISGAVRARTMFHAVQVRLAGPVLPNLSHETAAQLTYQQFRTTFGPEFFFDLVSDPTLSLRSAWTLRLSGRLEARAGLDVERARVRIDLNVPRPPLEGEPPTPVSVDPVIGLSKRDTAYQPAAFAELRWEPLRGLALLPGLRVDWYSPIRAWSVEPRLAARYLLAPGTTLKGGVGVYAQPPGPEESDEQFGNPDLPPERSVHVSAGLEQRIADGVDVDVTAFHKSLDRLVVRNPASAYDPRAVPYVAEGEGRIYGVEALLRARLGDRLSGFVAYTFQRSFRSDGFGEPERRFDFDQPHLLTVVASWRLARAWSAGARYRLVSGNPATPVTGSIYDAASGTYVPTWGAVNVDRLPSFQQLDLRVDRTWTKETWKLGLYLDVQNVANRGNVEGYSYGYDYSERTPLTGLPILPILGLSAEW